MIHTTTDIMDTTTTTTVGTITITSNHAHHTISTLTPHSTTEPTTTLIGTDTIEYNTTQISLVGITPTVGGTQRETKTRSAKTGFSGSIDEYSMYRISRYNNFTDQ
uniref:Uncharacterized protein n=1 Tax=Cacopsylla melanoneura TaxID=428564 RepID=A0A8D8SLY0_9HEMI